jgi:Putative polyhydroxyalkanoic acid system protein (PHA_gran_rgn)
LAAMLWQRPTIGSRVNREVHARFWERAEVKFLRATRHLFTVQDETWTGDHLQFRLTALGQAVSGGIDVADDHVRLEVVLPWLLAMIAEKIQPLIRKEGTLMLEKK